VGWFKKKAKLEFTEVQLSDKALLFIHSTPEHFRLGSLVTFDRDIHGESYPKLDARGIAAAMDSIIISQGAVSAQKIFDIVSRDGLMTELFVNRLVENIASLQLEVGTALESETPLSRKSLEQLSELMNGLQSFCGIVLDALKDPINTPSGEVHVTEFVALMKLYKTCIEMRKHLMQQMSRTADYIDSYLGD
jgi:hypothetical protein